MNVQFYGNPPGVLITSECEPNHSPTLSAVVDLLFQSLVKVFYCIRS